LPYAINQQQIDSVLSLAAAERYGHFIRRVADWEELWGLKTQQGWVTVGSSGGDKCLPFWPHPKYAELSATSEWRDAVPERIELSQFMGWLPRIEEDGYFVAVFPTPSAGGVVVKPSELQAHLSEECRQYE
jgi:hypothetical protein